MRIERIERRARSRRVDIHAGGEIALTIAAETAQDAGLRVGDDLSDADLARLRYDDDRRRALATSLRLIARRPRSEAELRDRLRSRGFGRQLIGSTIDRVRELGYLNDAAFADYWTETRQAASPRSRRLLSWELRGKGIDPGLAEAATAAIDDDEAAYRAIARRATRIDADDNAARRRLAESLARRGFAWGTIQRALERALDRADDE